MRYQMIKIAGCHTIQVLYCDEQKIYLVCAALFVFHIIYVLYLTYREIYLSGMCYVVRIPHYTYCVFYV